MDDVIFYYDNDILNDAVISFYNLCECKNVISDFINLYISDNKFYNYVQRNLLVNKIDCSYLLRLFDEYESVDFVDEYDVVSSVNTTRWI